MGKLTAKGVEALKPREKAYSVGDGDALYLTVLPSGKKSWRYRYRIGGKPKTFVLGPYPDLSLAKAREQHRKARSLVAEGIDPSQQRKKQRAEQKRDKDPHIFAKAVDKLLSEMENAWSDKYFDAISSALRKKAIPVLGSKPLGEITPDDIRALLEKDKEKGHHEAGKKLLYYISTLYGAAGEWDGWAVKDNPAKSINTKVFFKAQVKKKYPAPTDPREVAGLLNAIDASSGWPPVRLALKMLAYTALRPGNVRMMEWEWIREEEKLLVVPKEALKLRKRLLSEYTDFKVPLSPQAMRVLEEAKRYSDGQRYVFASIRRGRPLSDMALITRLRDMGYSGDQVVPHSFRSIFSTLAHEEGLEREEAIEASLAHFIGKGSARRYNRADYVKRRRILMDKWGAYLDRLQGIGND